MGDTITPASRLDTLANDLLAALQEAAAQGGITGSFGLQRWSFARRYADCVALNVMGKKRGLPVPYNVFLLQEDDGIWFAGRTGAESTIQKAVDAAFDKTLGQIPADNIQTANASDFHSAVFAPDQKPVAGYALSGLLGQPVDARLQSLAQRLYTVSTELQPRDSDAHVITAVHPATSDLPAHLLAVIHANPGVAGPQTDGPVFTVGAVIEDGKLQIFTPDDKGANRAARRRQQRQLERMDSKARVMNTDVVALAAALVETIQNACEQ